MKRNLGSKNRKGFSKYDNSGNVIYSESIDKERNEVHHFYKYDKKNRRIWYKKESISDSFIYEEYITYNDSTGTKIINTYSIPEYIMKESRYSNCGRLEYERIENCLTGEVIYREYNFYIGRYTVLKSILPYYYKK